MDIQDKAFKEWFAQYDNNIEYASEKIAWDAWKEVKAQADQKVKLLLCDEHLKKCESPTGIFNSQYPDEEPCLICLAKEAKAQAAPEKDAVIKKLSDQLYEQEMKTSAARVLCETACELLDDYAHQDAMVILNDLEQAMSTGARQ